MSHPIIALQTALLDALFEDISFVLRTDGQVFDAPPKGAMPPYVAINRHDIVPRDGDGTPGYDHRLVLHCWAAEPSRSAALALADHVLAAAAALTGPEGLAITHQRHERTETAIDGKTGLARAVVALRFFTEPN